MDLLKLEDRTLAELYEAFKDNNDFIVKEGDKYTEATNRILKLDTLKDINELRKLRNNFVYTVSDLMSASRNARHGVRENAPLLKAFARLR